MHDMLSLVPSFSHVSVRVTLDREHGYTSCTLYRGYASLTTRHVSRLAKDFKALRHFQGEWLGIHCETFIKFC
jgi:hypothetical protein